MPSVYLHLKDALAHYKHNSRLRNLSLASVVGYGVGEATWSLQAAFYNTVLPVWAVGLFMSFNFLASTISYRVSGWVIDKFKALNLLIFQEVYSRILYVVALIRPTVASPALMAAASVLYGTGEVAKSTLLQREFTDNQRATMASINSLAGNVFFAVFAVLVGFLADRVGLATSLLIAQVCLLPVLYTYIKLFRSRNSIKTTNVLQPRG